jgi:hypothetical protein
MHDVEHVFMLLEMLMGPVRGRVRGDDPDVVLRLKPLADTLGIGD